MCVKVSIIMGVFNNEKTIEKCIESILNQTYKNFEFIICDDGSTDNTYQILERYASIDNRVKVYKNKKNMGLATTLNRCIALSTGELIARQDGDDYSVHTRIEKQVDYLCSNPHISYVTSHAFLFDDDGIWGERGYIYTNQCELTKQLLRKNIFIHPTLMIRKDRIESVGKYTISRWTLRTEDYDLWLKLCKKNENTAIIQEKLYYFREDKVSYSRKKFKYRVDECIMKYNRFKGLDIKWYQNIYIIRPIIVACIPNNLLRRYHRNKSKLNDVM